MVRREDIEKEVMDMISDHFCMLSEDLDQKTNFTTDLNADSLDSIDIVMKLEDRFNLMITNDDADGIMTIENIIELIVKKMEEKES